MAADPSIYAQLGANAVQPVNALAMQGQVAQTANALLGVRQLQAQQAAGQAFQASINPDGTTNQTALLQNLKSDPAAAMAAQPAAQAGQTLSSAEYAQHMTHLQYGANAGAQLLTVPGGPTLPAIKAAYDQAVQDGHMTPADEAAVMQGFGNDPVQNATVIKQRLFGNLSVQQALLGALPAPTPTNTGGTTFFRDANPITNPNGMGAPGTSFANTTGPDTNAALVSVMVKNADGTYQEMKVPRSSLPGASGAPPQSGPPIPGNGAYRPRQSGQAATGQAPPSPAPTASTLGGQAYAQPAGPGPAPSQSDASTSPDTPAASSAPNAPVGAAGAPPGAVLAGAPQGQPEQLAVDKGAFNQAQAAVPATVRDTQNLGHALDALKILQDSGPLTTGTGSEQMHKMYGFLQTYGALPERMTPDLANYEIAKKALVNFAASQAGAAHTDLGLSTAAAGNPSVDGMSNLAAQTVVKQRLGNLYQSIAQVNEAPDPTGSGYNAHAARFAQNTDPRAFAFDTYTPAEQTKIIGSLGGRDTAAYRKFVGSLAIAKKYGFINPPQPASSSPATTSAAAPSPTAPPASSTVSQSAPVQRNALAAVGPPVGSY